MRKLQKKILAVLCLAAMVVSSLQMKVFAEELSEEPKEVIEEPVEEEKSSDEGANTEKVSEEDVKEESIEVTEESSEDETDVREESKPTEMDLEKTDELENTESSEVVVESNITEVTEESVKDESIQSQDEFAEEKNEEKIEKKIHIAIEVADDAKAGDIFRLICQLEGYEEGTYELQWQYITTDWYGNYTGDWSDLAGENDMELEIVINEENALRAWRVVVTEI